MSMNPEKWQYLKTLQPSPGRYIHVNPHPNRKTRVAEKLFDRWVLDDFGLPTEHIKQPINTPYRNPDPARNQKRKTIRVIGARKFKRISKFLSRSNISSEALDQIASFSQSVGEYE